MFCTNCGNKLEAHMIFCTVCGTQASKPHTQQASTQPMPQQVYPYANYITTYNQGRKNTKYILIAVFAVIGVVLLLSLHDNTGLVGTWEKSEQARWGVHERTVMRFNRNGTGSMRVYENLRYAGSSSFSWEVSRDGQLVITFREGLNVHTHRVDFSVSRNTLVIDGALLTRR